MEHAHKMFTHAGVTLTVEVHRYPVLVATVESYSLDALHSMAADRLDIHGIAVECNDADPYWCAAVLMLYPLLSEIMFCE